MRPNAFDKPCVFLLNIMSDHAQDIPFVQNFMAKIDGNFNIRILFVGFIDFFPLNNLVKYQFIEEASMREFSSFNESVNFIFPRKEKDKGYQDDQRYYQ